MNTKKAMKLRKSIYGDMSHETRKYVISEKGVIANAPGSLRKKYQDEKRRTK